MIKFEHTIFSLPFAFIGALLARKGLPTAWQLTWIVFALIGGRSAAMTFNRIADVRYDRSNPRTRKRALPQGTLSMGFAVVFTIAMSLLFVFAAWQLNSLCFYLSFPTLAILLLYSFTKRFTWLSHVVLGWMAYAGIAVVASILYWEHRLVTPDDLSRINVAFFNLNGYVSILLLLTFAGDILIR